MIFDEAWFRSVEPITNATIDGTVNDMIADLTHGKSEMDIIIETTGIFIAGSNVADEIMRAVGNSMLIAHLMLRLAKAKVETSGD